MRNYVFLILLTSCYPDNSLHLRDEPINCVFYVDGLCVDTSGYDINPKMISWTIGRIEKYTNELITTNTLDLSQLMEDKLGVKYVDVIVGNVSGIYFSDYGILVKYPETDDDVEKCVRTYYVLAHEILHFIDYAYLGNSSTGHITVGLFAPISGEYDFVESEVYAITKYFCEGKRICEGECITIDTL